MQRSLELETVMPLAIQEAIQALPNNAFPDVAVSVTDSTGNTRAFRVTFRASENSGTQTKIVVVAGDSNSDDIGNQPMVRLYTAGSPSTVTTAVTYQTPATTEGLVCSGRGSCSADTGLCTCNTGFYGFSCSMQTALQKPNL